MQPSEEEIRSSQSLRVELLHGMNAPAFAAFTFPSFQRFLTWIPSTLLVVGAWSEGEPAGLLLAEAAPQTKSVQLLSVGVDRRYRRRGVARAMLGFAESSLAKLGFERIHATFASGRDSTPGVLGLLAGQQWAAPTRKHWICTAGRRFMSAPWVSLYKLPPGFDLMPWLDLSQEQRERLRNEPWVPYDLDPFRNETRLDPKCSLALLHHGIPAGWVLAQQRGSDTLVYASSYVRPDLRGRGPLIAAYATACKRQLLETERGIGVWIVPMTYPPMASFAERRMRPYLEALDEFLTAEKQLPSGSASLQAIEDGVEVVPVPQMISQEIPACP